LCTPGVSTKTICAAGCFPFTAGTSKAPWMRVRVVCGLAVTIATFSPTSALINVDFPALGRPIMETNPDFKLVPPKRSALPGPRAAAQFFDPSIREFQIAFHNDRSLLQI